MSGAEVRFGWHCSHESFQPEELVEQAVAAEEAGFDLVLASDHFHPWVDDCGRSGFVWSWLGAVAQATRRVELVTNVTCPLFHYHPAVVAQAAATIDRLSGGRFVLGVGTGENLNEGPLGFRFPPHRERLARLSEAVGMMRSLLDGEKVTRRGEHYTLDRARLYSPPVERVPILVAAGGPRAATFAAREADGLITAVRDEAASRERVVGPYLEARAGTGLPGRVIVNRWGVVADDEAEAWDLLRPMRGLWVPDRLGEIDPEVLRRRSDTLDRRSVLRDFSIVRGVEDLTGVYRPLLGLGATDISMQVAARDPLKAISEIGARVLPELRS